MADSSIWMGVEPSPSVVSDGSPTAKESAVSRIRTELLTTFLARMNREEIPYCLLHGYQDYPNLILSDVDFMVRSNDAARIAPLLVQVAQKCDAQFLQALQHETGACYFVLAKREGEAVGYLHLDCSTDYRRNGRLWLAAKPVIEHRRRYKTFFVPAIADEFAYYIIKKILKQQITDQQLRQLRELYVTAPPECRTRMQRLWPEQTVVAVEQALSRQDIPWIRCFLPALLSELLASDPMEPRPSRAKQLMREGRRRLDRVLRPTGLSISIRGGTAQHRLELAQALESTLRPAFRRTDVIGDAEGRSLCWAASEWAARARSTLVVRANEATGARYLGPHDICFVFPGAEVYHAIGKRPVYLDGRLPLRKNVEYATRVTLDRLADRLERRMKLGVPDAQLLPELNLQDAK